MPLWKIYHPAKTFSEEDKQSIAQRITGMYESFLPRFYVNVFFHELSKSSFYIGGEPTEDFVRVTIAHLARSIKDAEAQQRFLQGCAKILEPFVAARGLRWELHVDETPFELWTVNGLKPPLPDTPEEQLWRKENRAIPYGSEAS